MRSRQALPALPPVACTDSAPPGAERAPHRLKPFQTTTERGQLWATGRRLVMAACTAWWRDVCISASAWRPTINARQACTQRARQPRELCMQSRGRNDAWEGQIRRGGPRRGAALAWKSRWPRAASKTSSRTASRFQRSAHLGWGGEGLGHLLKGLGGDVDGRGLPAHIGRRTARASRPAPPHQAQDSHKGFRRSEC